MFQVTLTIFSKYLIGIVFWFFIKAIMIAKYLALFFRAPFCILINKYLQGENNGVAV
jgi:hypothetical protein